jgi:hypothetical protein
VLIKLLAQQEPSGIFVKPAKHFDLMSIGGDGQILFALSTICAQHCGLPAASL